MQQDRSIGSLPADLEARSEKIRVQQRHLEKVVADHLEHFGKAAHRGDIKERDHYLQMFRETHRALNKLYDEGIKLILPNYRGD